MRIIIGLLLTSFICLQGCGQNNPVGGSETYPHILKDAYKAARKSENLRSLLVNRNGDLIAEIYYDKYSSDSLEHVRSVTKSVMSTLIGIAIDKEFIAGVDEPINKYLPTAAIGKEKITIKHLLTMTSGISWSEGPNAAGYNAWARSANELKYVLDKPVAAEPGTVWNYNSGAIHILSAILTEASGMNTLQFANKFLFEPIGIDNIRWQKQSDGYYNGAAGLELKPKDMIKFGQLFANGGTYAGSRIISESFIKQATSHHQPEGMKIDENNGYGYCWWLAEVDGVQVFAAIGYAGQVVAVSPELNSVVAITHNWKVNGNTASAQEERSTNTLVLKVVEGILEN